MPSFDTPGPITLALEIGVGDVRIVASERTDTVVDVRPSDPAKPGDVTAAEQARVELTGGRLLIKSAKTWRRYTPRGGAESIDVEIALPEGSQLRAEIALATVHATGRLGECRIDNGFGDVALDETGPLEVKTGGGEISVEHVGGDANVKTGTGAIRIGDVDGAAVVKNSNGDTTLGDVGGDLRVSNANGRIAVGAVGGTAVVKTANGDIELAEVVRGSIVATTAAGKVAVGVREGVAAYLDLNTGFGAVNSALEATGAPGAGEDTVEVKVRSGFGDITIRRSVVTT
ncbi:DUF4097 family beta strand repeat-containing protein [Solirubrobacter soli]|uniref:DUF4097 family beta strand repeat-containing protein n=1 Tax=Solirubrobacter soli TaxID=363832 RepID=UPI0003FD9F51|nr:DUF4097 family beta strand repeat-containing protein [Solirubrobacter soli]